MPEIVIKPAPIALKGQITELCRQTYEAHWKEQPYTWPKNFFEVTVKPVLDASFSRSEGKSIAESRTIFVALNGGAFAGYVHLTNWSKGLGGELNSGNILDICVLPEYRGQGVAKALLNHAKAIAKEHDWDDLGATVAGWNAPSTVLFEQAGFTLKSREYRFGPVRQAADLPPPKLAPFLSPKDWFWIALTGINILVLLNFLIR